MVLIVKSSLNVVRLGGQTEGVAVICEVGAVHIEFGIGVIPADIRHLADVQRDVLRGEDGDLLMLLELLFKELLSQIHNKNLHNV
jgi:hypothetical protein